MGGPAADLGLSQPEYLGILRPVQGTVVNGPALQVIEAVVPNVVVDSGSLDSLWVRDGGWPGVCVVETPLEKCLLARDSDSPVRRAVVQVAVEPGESAVMVGASVPWYIGLPDESLERAAIQSQVVGELLSLIHI